MTDQAPKKTLKKVTQNETGNSTHEPLANLFFQQVLFFEYYFNYIYTVLQILSFVSKNSFLPYPNTIHLKYEWVLMFCLIFMNYIKVYLGNLGNKSESSNFIGTYILICIGSIIGYVFFMRVQTFVLMLEFIINLIGLIISGVGLIFGFLAKTQFANAEKNMYY